MRHLAVTMTVAAAMLVGCKRPAEEITAPRMHFGQDVCAKCSMIISDDRFAD